MLYQIWKLLLRICYFWFLYYLVLTDHVGNGNFTGVAMSSLELVDALRASRDNRNGLLGRIESSYRTEVGYSMSV
jgi:hypothetical protein